MGKGEAAVVIEHQVPEAVRGVEVCDDPAAEVLEGRPQNLGIAAERPHTLARIARELGWLLAALLEGKVSKHS